ncbi:hypothetical protein DYBT9275_01780 [Dyadobacter sp. CECT 9275]|uniref:Uncharacterized protein n=1 Tax=Dyadobacter helix TaxID=2822344 RepID=A0A916JAY2_9BACT|nr:hypothetical protein [Dyadobacter sp. CECT 9275]CAG4997459.1 hypothetical protein DYBT9275_01780 [Dyadobacter sp. CECT 9275]
MKTPLKSIAVILLSCTALVGLDSCKKKDAEPVLVGSPGNPRFNLQFDNEDNVDLDLYVTDPTGETLSYRNTSSNSGGELDVDCLCDECPNGPNENIFWPEDDSAPKGVYKFWVQYYGDCSNGGSTSSDFTVRVTNNRKVVNTYEGTLSSGRSTVWTYEKR